MERREFIKTLGLPVLAAVGMVAASALGDSASAWKKKRGNSSKSGNRNKSSSGGGNNSNLSSAGLGSGRLKTDQGSKNDKGLIVYDDLSK